MASLTGKVAIVTGAAQGLGQEYCLALAVPVFSAGDAYVRCLDSQVKQETVHKAVETGQNKRGEL